MISEGKKQPSSGLRARIRSFRYAFAGIAALLQEPNARIHCAAALLVIAFGIWCNISAGEWLAVILCIGIVPALEAVNTAIEAVCDHVAPQHAPLIKRAKDTAAAAVLIAAIAAVATALVIFIPKIF